LHAARPQHVERGTRQLGAEDQGDAASLTWRHYKKADIVSIDQEITT